MGNLLHEEITFKINGCAYKVRNAYGMHHKEIVFHKGLAEQFTSENIPFVSQPRINIHSALTGKPIAVYVPDFLVADLVIVELKATPYTTKGMEMQLCEYLKTSQYEVGIYLNFGEETFHPRRFIFTNDRKPFLQI